MNDLQVRLDKLLSFVFPACEERARWLREPQSKLGDVPPALRIAQGEAWIQPVIALLEERVRRDHGIYS